MTLLTFVAELLRALREQMSEDYLKKRFVMRSPLSLWVPVPQELNSHLSYEIGSSHSHSFDLNLILTLVKNRVEIEGRKYYSDLLKYVRIYLVEAGNAILPVFDEALRTEALKMLTERETRLIDEGLIQREITSVILKSGVK